MEERRNSKETLAAGTKIFGFSLKKMGKLHFNYIFQTFYTCGKVSSSIDHHS